MSEIENNTSIHMIPKYTPAGYISLNSNKTMYKLRHDDGEHFLITYALVYDDDPEENIEKMVKDCKRDNLILGSFLAFTILMVIPSLILSFFISPTILSGFLVFLLISCLIATWIKVRKENRKSKDITESLCKDKHFFQERIVFKNQTSNNTVLFNLLTPDHATLLRNINSDSKMWTKDDELLYMEILENYTQNKNRTLKRSKNNIPLKTLSKLTTILFSKNKTYNK